MDELWTGDREVLTRIVELFEVSGRALQVAGIVEEFSEGRRDQVVQSIRRLSSHGYLVTVDRGGGLVTRGHRPLVVTGVTERALQTVGAWPSDAALMADRLLELLAEQAESEPEPGKRSKLQSGLKGLRGMTREVLVDVLGSVITKSAGLS